MSDGQPLRLDRGHGNAIEVLRAMFPDAKQQPDLYDKLWSDLYNEKLVRTPGIDNGAEGDWRSIRRTTDIGAAYLAFIRDPLQ